MNPRPRSFRHILRDQGYYKKWHAQVMADILLPLIQDENPPEENGSLMYYKYGDSCDMTPVTDHMLGLYLVREVFRNLGLTSTDKIFEHEAGLSGTEQRFADSLRERFKNLALTTKEHVQPPLLSQILFMVQMHKLKQMQMEEGESIDVRFGKPANLKTERFLPENAALHEGYLPVEDCDFSSAFNVNFNMRNWGRNTNDGSGSI